MLDLTSCARTPLWADISVAVNKVLYEVYVWKQSNLAEEYSGFPEFAVGS
jgi:hypothetical protein